MWPEHTLFTTCRACPSTYSTHQYQLVYHILMLIFSHLRDVFFEVVSNSAAYQRLWSYDRKALDRYVYYYYYYYFDPGTSFPGCEILSKVCGVWNGYNGDSEIVKVLDRQTALKCWIYAEIRWYRNVISRGSAVLREALLPISEINSCASSAKMPRVSTATG